MFEGLMEGRAATIALAIAVVAVGLVLLALVMRLMRGRGNATFIRGGKNRQPRLAVLDAAAVDTRRRLVLVRRDDVEHLIMIGGPSDIVIESRILPPSMPSIDPVPLTDRLVDEPRPHLRATGRPVTEPAPQPMPQAAAQPVAEPGQRQTGDTPPTPRPNHRPAPAGIVTDASADSPASAPPRNSPPAAPAIVPMPQPYAEFAEPSLAAAPSRAQNVQDSDAASVLDAARSRVLIDRERAARDPNVTVAEMIEGRDGGQSRIQAARPDSRSAVVGTMTAPAVSAAQTPETSAAISGRNPFDDADFGAILDAEMSGDLASLDISPAGGDRAAAKTGNMAHSPQDARRDDRQPPAQRTEGSLEEEMARLLGDMAPTRR